MKLKFRAAPRAEIEISGSRVIFDANDDEVAYVPFDEDAEFIVTACNAHDQLVAALKACIDADGISERRAANQAARAVLAAAGA